jgi:hypothetical protein
VEILQPREKALNLPAPFVAAAKFSAVLRFPAFSIQFVRRNQLSAELRRFLYLLIKIY